MGPPEPRTTEPFCPGVGWLSLLKQEAKRRYQRVPKEVEERCGGTQQTRGAVLIVPLWGLSLAWICSGLGAGQAGRQPARGLGLCAICPEGTQTSRSLAISGLGTKNLWK